MGDGPSTGFLNAVRPPIVVPNGVRDLDSALRRSPEARRGQAAYHPRMVAGQGGGGRVAAAIPAYQAAPSVGAVVAATLAVLPDVLVVDDGSTDGTGAAAEGAGARVVRHAENRGKGRALATAFEDLFARGFEAVVTLDADGQHLGGEIPKLLAAWRGGAELVVGSRARLFGQMHVVRSVANALSSRLLSLAAGRRLPDAQSGFRLYTRTLVGRTGFPESGFEAESAVLIRAARGGARLAWPEIELGFADGRLTSHYRPVADSLRIAVAAVRARFSPPAAAAP